MNLAELEKRLAVLEQSVADLQEHAKSRNPWQKIIGHFANDPVYDEIIRLGKEHRDSQQPDKKKRKRKA